MVVTGGTRGIGRGIAERLHAEGARVSVCARGEVGGAAPYAEHAAQCDVTDAQALAAYVNDAAAALGGLDAVVANAGGSSGSAALLETTAEDWRRTLDLNVVHAAVLIAAALPHLRASGGGAALVISSISAARPQPKAQYAAAKAAQVQLVSCLARELAPDGVRVVSLSPGSVLFPGGGWAQRRQADPAAFQAWVDKDLPLGRLGSVAEIADVAAFLLSARASWVSGTDVVVDGAQLQPGMGGY